jgi:hypothetical protein
MTDNETTHTKTVKVSKRIVDDHKHHIGDIYNLLVSGCNELGLSVEEMNSRWDKSGINDLEKFEGVFFILTGTLYSKE